MTCRLRFAWIPALVTVQLIGAGQVTPPADWGAEGNQAGANFGSSVANAGDVNGDGFGDLLVGARYYDGAQVNEGAAFLYYGSPGGLAGAPAWSATGGQSDAHFGIGLRFVVCP